MSRREERLLLDTIRWISALMVGIGHALGLVFSRDATFWSRLVWYIADMRGAWVMLFFVLSGYLVGGNFIVRMPSFDVRQYFIARFSRIYIALLPALLLTAGLDGAAYLWAPDNPVYSHPWPNGVLGATTVFSRYNWTSAVSSLLSIESIVGTGIGSDGVLWSLGYEWVFYFVFPLLTLAGFAISARFKLSKGAVVAVLIVTGAIGLTVFHQGWGGLFWLVWTSGALAHVLAETKRFPAWLRWLGGAICVVGILIDPFADAKLCVVMIGFGFAAFLSLFPSDERGINQGIDKRLAGFSYSFYIVHLPILAFLTLGFVKLGWMAPGGVDVGPLGLGCLLIMMVAAIAVSFVFGQVFERRTDALRRHLGRTAHRPVAHLPTL